MRIKIKSYQEELILSSENQTIGHKPVRAIPGAFPAQSFRLPTSSKEESLEINKHVEQFYHWTLGQGLQSFHSWLLTFRMEASSSGSLPSCKQIHLSHPEAEFEQRHISPYGNSTVWITGFRWSQPAAGLFQGRLCKDDQDSFSSIC